MQLNARSLLTQFAHLLQDQLFPVLDAAVGPLNADMELLVTVSAMAPVESILSARRADTGRPARDRAALATAFIAKAILNLPTTRDLISRLKVDEPLRRVCGWASAQAIPHESKFSRAFSEFAQSELPQRLHQAVIAATQKQRLIGHIARDSTAIKARERCDEVLKEMKQAAEKQRRKNKKGKAANKHVFARKKAAARGARIQQ